MKTDRAPDVEILEFNLAGPVLAVRPYCHTDHYWQVYFDTNRVIRESFGAAGFPVPEQHLAIRIKRGRERMYEQETQKAGHYVR